MAKQLHFPPANEAVKLSTDTSFSRRCLPELPSWPWAATMLTAANCYMLWALTWLQFVVIFSTFSYQGANLWFYTTSTQPLSLTVPESFLAYSIALTVFALCAVTAATWHVPRLWKRLLAVSIFAALAIGLSLLSLHLRHYSYTQAQQSRTHAHRIYHRNLQLNYNSTDWYIISQLELDKQEFDFYDSQIQKFHKKYKTAQ